MGILDSGAIGQYHKAMGGETGAKAASEAAALQMLGYKKAAGQLEPGYAEAMGYYNPYIQPGQQAFDVMAGAYTPEGYAQRLQDLQSSPAIQELINQRMTGVERALSTGGLSRSGYGASQMANVTPDVLMNIENMLYGRTAPVAQAGMQAGQALSGLTVDKTNALTNLLLSKYSAAASGVLGKAQALTQGATNRYTAMHNAGSSVMGMFGGMMGGNNNQQAQPATSGQGTYYMPQNNNDMFGNNTSWMNYAG